MSSRSTSAPQFPDLAVAERQQYLTIAMRDYLNEGGKLAYAGETTGVLRPRRRPFGGIYYGLDGHPEQECVVTADPSRDCLLLADDFTQYWMGAYDRAALTRRGRGRHGRAARRLRGALRRPGDGRQPDRRGRRLHADE